MISLENEEDSKFYNELLFNEEITEDGMILGNNRKTKEALRTLRVPNAIFDDIYDYFVTDSYLLKFFEVQKTSKNVMIITIRKSAIWEIEEPKE